MGWNLKKFLNIGTLIRLLAVVCSVTISAGVAHAQAGGYPPGAPGFGLGGWPTTPDITWSFTEIQNTYDTLAVGWGSNVAGSLGYWSNPSNPTDPWNEGIWNAMLKPPDNPFVPYYGGWLFIRIDDGTTGNLGGNDYIWGDPANGAWIAAPTVIGNYIEAQWTTKPFISGSGTGTGTGATAVDTVEVDVIASFIHDTVRFSFTARNKSTGNAHKIGLAFVQDISVQLNTIDLDGPLLLPNSPNLHKESLLSGSSVPAYWETYVPISPATANASAKFHGIRATLRPTTSAATEPTTPTRMAYGRCYVLEGMNVAAAGGGKGNRVFDQCWKFENYMDPTLVMDKNVGLNSTDAAVVLYWDEQLVPAGGQITTVAFIGEDTSNNDFTGPMTLSVSGSPALGFSSNGTTATSTPSPFTIQAFVQNLTDLNTNGNQFSIPVVSFSLDLPPGLMLAAGETNPKVITGVAAGSEAAVSWNVQQDTSNPHSGTLTYTVTAAPSIGNGKAVQRTVQVPAPTVVTLDPDVLHPGYFKMKSFPYLFGSTTPSQALGLPQGTNITPQIDTRSWQPGQGAYIENPSWVPGFAYWVKYTPTSSSITTPQNFQINGALYPPLDQQIQPTATSYTINYPQGWNQIGDPYLYDYKFSELQVFNPQTLVVTDIGTAANNTNQWIGPYVYFYNSSDPNPANWTYNLEENMGFTMAAGEGYWIYVEQPNLQFIFTGTDTPGGSVSRAAKLGVGLGTVLGRGTSNNWRLQFNTKSTHGTDNLTYIGMAPQATNTKDIYKYSKPPAFNPGTSLNIVHTDWGVKGNGNYAQDLRAPGQTSQTWNMQLTTTKGDKEVTITWPAIAANVPRNYDLFLVDPTTNAQQSLRDTSSYVVQMGTATTRDLQIIAKPRNPRVNTAITSFDVVAPRATKSTAPTAVTINYTLSSTADTQINIRNGQGRVIRTINNPTRATTDGGSTTTGQVVWDLKDNRGVSLTSGTYNVEIVAVSTSGQRVRQIKPFTLVGR